MHSIDIVLRFLSAVSPSPLEHYTIPKKMSHVAADVPDAYLPLLFTLVQRYDVH